jgi:hypothetical protein
LHPAPISSGGGTSLTQRGFLKNRLLRDDAARLLTVRARVTVEEPRRELLEYGHLVTEVRIAIKVKTRCAVSRQLL